MIPSGGTKEMFEAARVSGVEILVLEKNHPGNLDDIYLNPERQSNLSFIEDMEGIKFFEIQIMDGSD